LFEMRLVNLQLVAAIKEKRLIEFAYKGGRPRIVEPHDYGVRGGVEKILAYQISGDSSSGAPQGWKWFEVANVQQLTVLERHFPGTRADNDQNHFEWDTLFARVA
jgi:hypothetical protein